MGTIIDFATRELLEDVVVTVSSAVPHEWIVFTDKRGDYRILDLRPGIYALRLDKHAYRTQRHCNIQLGFTALFRLDAEMLSSITRP